MKIYIFAIKMIYPKATLTHLLEVECDDSKKGEDIEDVLFARDVAYEYANSLIGRCGSIQLRSN